MGAIKGITIEIGAKTTALDSALRNIKSNAADLSRNLKVVKQDLAFNDGGSFTKLSDAAKLAAEKVKAAADKIDVLKAGLKKAEDQSKLSADGAEKYAKAQEEIQKQLATAEREHRLANSVLEEYRGKLDAARGSANQLATEILKLGAGKNTTQLKALSDLYNGLEKESKEAAAEVAKLEREIRKHSSALGSAETASSEYIRKQKELEKALENAKKRQRDVNQSFDETKRAIGKVQSPFSGFIRLWSGLKGKIDEAKEKAAGFFQGLAVNLSARAITTLFNGIVNGIKSGINFAKDYAKEAVEMAAGYEDALGYTEQVFGKNSAAIRQWVEENTLALRLNKAELLDSVNQFGGLFSAVGVGKEKAQEFSTSLVQLAADMSAATGVPIAQVIENLRSVMTGGAEAGYKYGLVIKEGAVKLKALQMGLVQTEADMTEVNGATLKLEQAQKNLATALSNHGEESLEYRQALQKVTEAEEALETAMEGKEIALTEAQKAEARHALIMEQSAAMQGQAARESGNYKSQLGLLKTVFDNLKLSIGEKLLPVFTQLITKFNEFIGSDEGKEFLDGIVESIGNLADKVLAFVQSGDFERFITDMKEKLPSWAKDIETIVTGLADFVGSIAEFWREMEYTGGGDGRHAYLKVADDVKAFANEIGIDLGEAKGYISDYAIANRTHLETIYNNWAEYEPLIAQYISDTQTKTGEMSDGLGTSMTDAETALTTGAAAIDSKMSEIETSVSDAKDSVTDSAAGIASGIQAGVNTAAGTDISGIESLGQRIADIWKGIKTAVSGIFESNGGYTPGTFYMGMASGGNVKAGVPYIVGEQGHELFIPRVDGRILNHQQTQQVLNQSRTDNSRNFGDIHIHVHSKTSDSGRADGYAAARGLVDELKSLGVVF